MRWRWQEIAHLFTREEDPARRRWSLLGSLLASGFSSRVNDDHDFRVFHMFIQSTRSGDFSQFHVRPFYSSEEDPTTGHYYRSFGTFLYVSSRADANSEPKRTLLGFIPL